MTRTLLAAVAVAALCATQPAAAATNLLNNGGFDKPGDFSGNYLTISEGEYPPGFEWTVNYGSVDIFRMNSLLGEDPDPLGVDQYALDLVGVGTRGGIYQGVVTEVGKTYRLSFDYANNPFIAGASMNFGISGFGGIPFINELSHSGSSPTEMGWQHYTFDFVATSVNSNLFFNNLTGGPNGGMFLDNIAIFDPNDVGGVPEPGTWALMIAGVALAGATLRYRRRLVAV